jgi:predicted  nucleic acid-binding Zn-ribbon protein
MASEWVDQLESEISSLDYRLSKLHREALLTEVNDEIEEISSQLAQLPLSIEEIRSRGYAFKSYLERKAEVLKEQWRELSPRVQDEVDRQSRSLSFAVNQAGRELNSLRMAFQRSPASARPRLETCRMTIERLEDRVRAASEGIRSMFDTLEENVEQAVREVKEIAWMFDQLDEACFGVRPQEAPIEATEATYLAEPKKGPKGILYLTDQRLLFERKEEVVTKKVLFIPTQKKRVQELLFDVPIGAVKECVGEEKGFILRKEILGIRFSSGAPVREARFQLTEDSSVWRALIGKVLSGEIERERAVPREEVPAEEVKEIPTRCPACGALFTQEIVRGMISITCEYCGNVIRLS